MKVIMAELVKNHHPISANDIVIDCGGYKGTYTEELLKRFDCKVLLFEPVPEYAAICKEKFKDKNVDVINAALSNYSGKNSLYLAEYSSSFYYHLARSENLVEVDVIRAKDIVSEFKPKILKLNCEGEEYNILEELYEYGLLRGIKEILVQFHKGNKLRYTNIQRMLSVYHKKVYKFKWELWRLKSYV